MKAILLLLLLWPPSKPGIYCWFGSTPEEAKHLMSEFSTDDWNIEINKNNDGVVTEMYFRPERDEERNIFLKFVNGRCNYSRSVFNDDFKERMLEIWPQIGIYNFEGSNRWINKEKMVVHIVEDLPGPTYQVLCEAYSAK